MTRYKDIHHHGVNAVFNPSHKHSNMVFPEKKSSYFGEGIIKNLISHWNKQLTRKATVFTRQTSHNSIHSSWISDCFLSLVESFYETYMRTGPISSKRVCIVTTRRMWQFQTNENVNHVSCMGELVIVTELAYRIYRNCIN